MYGAPHLMNFESWWIDIVNFYKKIGLIFVINHYCFFTSSLLDRFLIFRNCFGWGVDFFSSRCPTIYYESRCFFWPHFAKVWPIQKNWKRIFCHKFFFLPKNSPNFQEIFFGEIYVTFQHLTIQSWGSLSPAYLEFSRFSQIYPKSLGWWLLMFQHKTRHHKHAGPANR